MSPVAPIPAGGVLLHVGMPKSGTTAIQRAASQLRTELLEHGVRYPGDRYNHSLASFAVAERPRKATLATGHKKTDESHWTGLVAEVRAETERRVLISHEFFAEHPAEVCRRVVAELDREVHVVFTMRNQASLLASTWQQYLKSGATWTFDEWLDLVLGDRTGANHSFDRRTDLSGVVDKWGGIVGLENVTVVVLDRAEPDRLTDTFEDLLDLPRSLLGAVDLSGDHANRSFVASEIELLRELNLALRGSTKLSWSQFRELYRGGGIFRLLAREPGTDEATIATPQWAVDEMTARARAHVERLAASGVRVVGDLEALARPVRGVPQTPPAPTQVPLLAARALALGILEGAVELDAAAEARHRAALERATTARSVRPVPAPRGPWRTQVRTSTRATQDVPARVLAQALLGRTALRLRSLVDRSPRTKD